MRRLLSKQKLGGLILTALTAGAFSVPAVAAQDGSAMPAKKLPHKTSSGTSTSHTHSTPNSAGHSTTAHTSTTHSNSAHTKSSSRTSSKKRTKKVKGQAAPTPERINEIQEALAKKGVFSGTPTGQWDDSTVEAMKKFQSSNGLNPSGKLDALTLQKLGLGSETAGLAAPTPPPNSSNRLRNMSSMPAETTNNQ
jgi:murein L,D-transpeptidase YcbB/YkuD